MTAAGATGAGPPGTWRLLAPALLGWALTAGAITSPGAGARMAWAAAICGAAAGLGSVIAGAARGRAVSGTVVATAGPGEPEGPSRRPRRRAMTGVVLIVCAVPVLLGARIAVGEHARSDPALVVAAERGGSIVFEARLTGFPKTRPSEFGERSWVRAAAETPRGPVPVLLWLDEPPGRDWSPGTGLAVRGVPELFAPGDQAAFGIRVLDIEPLADEARGSDGRGFGALAADLRRGLHEAAGSVSGAELVPGFAVGDTALVDERLDRAMLESSLTHLTAVSGANCALVTGAMLWLMGRLGAGRRLRVLSAGVALMLFVGLIGPDASVQRAAVMAAVVLASGFGGRRAVALPALGLAVLVLLALDPWQSLQPGFALSVTATGGILLAAGPLASWLRRRARIPAFLALPVAVALAAQLACGPLILLLQAGIPAVGVLANVLAAPAAPLGTALGLLSALLLPLSPVLGEAALLLASLPARWVAAVAHTSAALPLARWHWPEGWPGALLLAGCEAGLLIAWALHRGHLGLPAGARRWSLGWYWGARWGRHTSGRWKARNHSESDHSGSEHGESEHSGAASHQGIRADPRPPWQPPERPPSAIRLAVASLVAAALGLFVAVTLVAPVADRLSTPRGWAVVACDVGQGDAVLLRDPLAPGETMLVDTGDDPELLLACLERFGVGRLSLLVLSHDDRDHVGALEAVVDRVDAALIAPDAGEQVGTEREVVRQLEAAGVPYRVGAAGDARASAAGLAWRVLAPAAGARPVDTNAASLVMVVQAGSERVLLLGDTGLDEQQRLIRQYAEGSASATGALGARVIKAAHHGSGDQDHRLPALVGADWALVSVGAGNNYGHPAADTLAALSRTGTRVLRTDLHGSIALVPSAGGALEPWVERPVSSAPSALPVGGRR